MPGRSAVEEAAEHAAAAAAAAEPAAATAEHATAHLLRRQLVLHLLVLRNPLLQLLVGVVDEAVDRLEQAVDPDLLVLDVKRDLLEVEQPFPALVSPAWAAA